MPLFFGSFFWKFGPEILVIFLSQKLGHVGDKMSPKNGAFFQKKGPPKVGLFFDLFSKSFSKVFQNFSKSFQNFSKSFRKKAHKFEPKKRSKGEPKWASSGPNFAPGMHSERHFSCPLLFATIKRVCRMVSVTRALRGFSRPGTF